MLCKIIIPDELLLSLFQALTALLDTIEDFQYVISLYEDLDLYLGFVKHFFVILEEMLDAIGLPLLSTSLVYAIGCSIFYKWK